jgi:hypothetical protein
MRHGFDFIDLQNPKVCHPTVGLEQRIVIGAEMSRGAPTMDGDVQHAADVRAIEGTTMHAGGLTANSRRTGHYGPGTTRRLGLA